MTVYTCVPKVRKTAVSSNPLFKEPVTTIENKSPCSWTIETDDKEYAQEQWAQHIADEHPYSDDNSVNDTPCTCSENDWTGWMDCKAHPQQCRDAAPVN